MLNSHGNQSIDFHCNSVDYFLSERNLVDIWKEKFKRSQKEGDDMLSYFCFLPATVPIEQLIKLTS